jgi:uncharacterized protein YdeI (YjbR/CyaY-like superfamily)
LDGATFHGCIRAGDAVEIGKTLHVVERAKWRAWLEKNHARADEIWLLFHKKESGKPRLPYADAVEEALCFGWIDGIIKPIDAHLYAQRFTPRRPGGTWSDLNMKRVKELIARGLMTPAGMAEVERIHPARRANRDRAKDRRIVLPSWMKEALQADGKAWKTFQGLAPSYRTLYIRWVTEAKREETRKTRLERAVVLLARGQKHPLERPA